VRFWPTNARTCLCSAIGVPGASGWEDDPNTQPRISLLAGVTPRPLPPVDRVVDVGVGSPTVADESVPFLILSGPPGVGKTTVSWEVFDQLVYQGDHPALVDLDLLGACWPVPDDDPHNERLKAVNLGAMWQNFRRAGARCLIAAGVIESRETLRMYADAVPGSSPNLCRLTAGDDELRSRITLRGRERGDGLEKLHRRAVQLSRDLERGDRADFCVDTDGRSISDVADLVRAGAGGWPCDTSG
jgi:hypothetical protein